MQSLPGRPLIEVSMEKVKELRVLGLTCAKIADILHISRQNLYRRVDGSCLMGYTEVSNQELDRSIQAYKATHPNDGETIVTGHLRSLQINVPRRRIRESIRRVDPSGTEERARSTVRRQSYHVDAPILYIEKDWTQANVLCEAI